MDPQEAMRKDGFTLVSWNLECIVDKKLTPDMLEERTEVINFLRFRKVIFDSPLAFTTC
jgi:hypothetical protein